MAFRRLIKLNSDNEIILEINVNDPNFVVPNDGLYIDITKSEVFSDIERIKKENTIEFDRTEDGVITNIRLANKVAIGAK